LKKFNICKNFNKISKSFDLDLGHWDGMGGLENESMDDDKDVYKVSS
jgi:hypothetical protein